VREGSARAGAPLHCAELMTIHDEVLSECEPEMAGAVGRLVGRAFEESADLRVPIRWGWGDGERWGELEK